MREGRAPSRPQLRSRGSEVIKISDPDAVGPHLQKLYDTVQGIQYGRLPDTHGWCHEVRC